MPKWHAAFEIALVLLSAQSTALLATFAKHSSSGLQTVAL
jgi:hypothetical protein